MSDLIRHLRQRIFGWTDRNRAEIYGDAGLRWHDSGRPTAEPLVALTAWEKLTLAQLDLVDALVGRQSD